MPSLSLRCKRKDATVFLIVDSSDSFAKCKARLAEAIGVKAGARRHNKQSGRGEAQHAASGFEQRRR